ncbi:MULTISPECIES: sugar ABC transporter permease [unclassified Paenibacillus]|uniref:ABC transporter permease n=1 Tax=unclassified Paenibacillus TaxID=185978 RepID=UPI002789CC18|nr:MULTISPECIES: ABC transporter permease subunit [unclassified Paenibacillus]MDQ0899220.1 putative aldouronate transport system permease protein [Paenibacillus sp. V4I7]MDQ0914790.1 putative aldouronate transport system permease protein [Paenibacillus sp. V4I5]
MELDTQLARPSAKVGEKALLWKRFKQQKMLHLFVGLGMIFLLIFSYTPMFGIIMAFKDYSISSGIKGIFTSEWVGLKYFDEFVNDYQFGTIVRNTLMLSLLKVIFTFPAPIIFAIMLNEVKHMAFKRLVQTVSYLPHFISWVVVVSLAFFFLSADVGLVNKALLGLGLIDKQLDVLTNANYFWGLAVGSAMWKEMGWWTIIFLAAITGINPALYEAAQIDGAGRLARIRHITIPSMKGTIIVVLILTIGSILGGGLVGSNFEQAYLLGNTINNPTSEIVQTYAFKVGLRDGRFSYAAAIDLIQSFISVLLIFSSNYIAKRKSDSSLF